MGLGNTAVSMTAWAIGFIIVGALVQPYFAKGQSWLAGTSTAEA